MLFCLGTYNLVASLSSEFTGIYLDDGTIGRSIAGIETNIQQIVDQGKALGLFLNVKWCLTVSPQLTLFYQHSRPTVCSCFPCRLLGFSFGEGGTASLEQSQELKVMGERFCHLQMHDAITILWHSLSITKFFAHPTNMTCLFVTLLAVLRLSLEVHHF